jgi:hypothetical protein
VPTLQGKKIYFTFASPSQAISIYTAYRSFEIAISEYLSRLNSFNLSSFHSKKNSPTEFRDVFDGELYRNFHLNQLRLFRDRRDVALHMSLDGVQVINMRHHEVTPVILINLNLPPDERYKIENILVSLVIPGPHKPKELDTFLQPFVEEMKQLDSGIEAFDAYTKCAFTLRAWTIIVTGDGPAISDAIGFKRPGNAFRPCRFCLIKGQMEQMEQTDLKRSKTYYVPHTDYNFDSPPLRCGDLREVIDLVVTADSPIASKDSGINRASILTELRSLHFSRSFPIDIMHCILLNITETLFTLWNRTKLSSVQNTQSTGGDCYLSKDSIDAISKSLANARSDIPAGLCRAPRRIDNHYKGYKATEWEAWLIHYGIPLLDQHLGDDYVNNFRQLNRIYSLATQYTIQQSELLDLKRLTVDFIQSYERLYYRREPGRLPVCSVNIHYLLHLPACIQDCGPARYWWQFPMERYCGIVKLLARSKSQLNTSIANGVIITEHLHHIRFTQKTEPQSKRLYPILLDPLMITPHNNLRRSLSAFLQGNPTTFEFYRRCQIDEELTAGSIYSQRCTDINRRDNRICFQVPGQNSFSFATVHMFVKAVCHQEYRLAWIRNYNGIDIDRVKRIASFAGEGRRCWIDVAWIKSLFGILKDGGVNLIITDINLFD